VREGGVRVAKALKHSLVQDAAAQPKTAASGKTAREKPVSDRRQASSCCRL